MIDKRPTSQSVDTATFPSSANEAMPTSLPVGGTNVLSTSQRRDGASVDDSSLSAHRSPPDKRRVGLALLILAGALALTSLVLLLEIHRGDLWDADEARTVATSMETWHEAHRASEDRFALMPTPPTLRGAHEVERPPGIYWIHLQALTMADALGLADDTAVVTARVVSVVMTLLAMAAVFWAGYSIGGLLTGTYALLICISFPFLLYHGRLGTADTARTAFVTLAIAASLWAMRPLRPPSRFFRQAFGWLICGLSLGMAALVGGPMALSLTVAPIAAVILLCPRRFSHLLGFAAAISLGILLMVPWILFLQDQHVDRLAAWWSAWSPANWREWSIGPALGWRGLVLLLIALLPWTPWLIASLSQPMSTSSRDHRRRMFIGWLWFAVVAFLAVLVIPIGFETGGLFLPMLVAAGVMMGQTFRRFTDLSAEGRHPRMWRLLRWPHVVMMLVASVALPLALHFQSELIEAQWLSSRVAVPMSVFYWIGVGVVLLGLTGVTLRAAVGHYPGQFLAFTSAWTIAALLCLIVPLYRGPLVKNSSAADAQVIRRLQPQQPLFYIDHGQGGTIWRPEPALVAMAGRPALPMSPEQLASQLSSAEREGFLLMTPQGVKLDQAFEHVRALETVGMDLWRLPPMPATAESDTGSNAS